ncbi:MAG: hypothetical protein HQL07_14045 [Nitrospirae bacterium]|nr:hypothetical protein [Magnetococcales bacterium]HAT50263.1 hypothetical protein [Alphaproteobacteria bacterium]
MSRSLFRVEVLPFLLQFAALLALTIVGDFLLHRFGWVSIGRYMGIPGTVLLVLSLLYSLRKRKIITAGKPSIFLRIHEFFTLLGAWMILIHAGIHFNAVLPWLATMAMIINVISGFVGRYLLRRSQRHLMARQENHRSQGLSGEAVKAKLFWDAVTFDLMTQWRTVHFPISFAFAILAAGHIVSIFLFWKWP